MPTVIDGITGINRITGGADVGGNLDFVANGSRITGLFGSGAPTVEDRFFFQNINLNTQTNVGIMPNGSGNSSILALLNTSAPSTSGNFASVSINNIAMSIQTGKEAGSPAAQLPMAFLTSGIERMRIGENGSVCVGHTDTSLGFLSIKTLANSPRFYAEGYGASKGYGLVCRASSDDGPSILFLNAANAQNGMITHTATTTSYQTTSDYRLKENIRAMVAPLERLLRLKPVLFNWKVDGSEGEGFIAHQLQQEVPIAVSGEKDGAEMQGVDASKVVPLLVAAVQELTLKVLALEARLP